MYPRSGEHPNVYSFRFLVPGNIRQDHPFGQPPFCEPPNLAELSKSLNLGKDYLSNPGMWGLLAVAHRRASAREHVPCGW